MVQPALAASRAVAVLDWIVSHAGEALTLSEISRALRINVPSTMSVLQSLSDAGYLTRHPTRKTYQPGPALLTVGLVASSRHRALEILGPELGHLADAVGSECHASVIVGMQSIVVAQAGRPNKYSRPVKIGFRSQLRAPVGHSYMAWSPREEIEAWIDRGDPMAQRLDRARIYDELATVRRHGYFACSSLKMGYAPSIALDQLAASPKDPKRQETVRAAVAEFSESWELVVPEPGRIYDVSNISAPIFDSQGRAFMTIIINGFSQIEGAELLAHCERLLQMTRLLVKHGNGRMPD